jgi:signal peptidase I
MEQDSRLGAKRIWLIILFIVAGGTLVYGILPNLLKTHVIKAYRIPAASMQPTLMVGDYVLANMHYRQGNMHRGDIIVFRYPRDPRKDFVKRIIGLPGETIEIRSKQVYINSKPLTETYVVHTDAHEYPKDVTPRDNFGPITVPADHIFVMGDNRDVSNDSRFFGCVACDSIRGKVSVIYWSWDKTGSRIRRKRIGMAVH